MSALLRWPARPAKERPSVGQRRVVVRFLLLPKKLDGEWRWLGFECIAQEFQRYWAHPPDIRSMLVVGWRDIGWDP